MNTLGPGIASLVAVTVPAAVLASSLQVITVSQPMSHVDSDVIGIHDVTYLTSFGNTPRLGQGIRMTVEDNGVRAIDLAMDPCTSFNLARADSLVIDITMPEGFEPSGVHRRVWDWERDTVAVLQVKVILDRAIRSMTRDSMEALQSWRRRIREAELGGNTQRARAMLENPPHRYDSRAALLRRVVGATRDCVVRNAARDVYAVRELDIEIVGHGFEDLGGRVRVPGSFPARPRTF